MMSLVNESESHAVYTIIQSSYKILTLYIESLVSNAVYTITKPFIHHYFKQLLLHAIINACYEES